MTRAVGGGNAPNAVCQPPTPKREEEMNGKFYFKKNEEWSVNYSKVILNYC